MNLPSEVVLDYMSVPDPLESDYNLRVMLHYNHCRDALLLTASRQRLPWRQSLLEEADQGVGDRQWDALTGSGAVMRPGCMCAGDVRPDGHHLLVAVVIGEHVQMWEVTTHFFVLDVCQMSPRRHHSKKNGGAQATMSLGEADAG